MAKEIDYHAMLMVHGIDTMDTKTQTRLINWLIATADEFAQYKGKEFNKIFNKRFRARLMK